MTGLWSTFSLCLTGVKHSCPVCRVWVAFMTAKCVHPHELLAHMFWVPYGCDIIFKTSFEESKKKKELSLDVLLSLFSWDKEELKNVLNQKRHSWTMGTSSEILPFSGFRDVWCTCFLEDQAAVDQPRSSSARPEESEAASSVCGFARNMYLSTKKKKKKVKL